MTENNKKNAGFSLVELIVTVAIMSILIGGVSMGISLIFSRDAAKCANILNDTLYSVRMNSMSKPGRYTLVVKNDGGKYVAVITCEIDNSDGTVSTTSKTVYLEGDSNSNKIDTITAKLKKSGTEEQLITSATDSLKITFDKSKGCVITGSGTDFSGDGIIEFHITPKSSSRTADVSLITSTGKHTVGTY